MELTQKIKIHNKNQMIRHGFNARWCCTPREDECAGHERKPRQDCIDEKTGNGKCTRVGNSPCYAAAISTSSLRIFYLKREKKAFNPSSTDPVWLISSVLLTYKSKSCGGVCLIAYCLDGFPHKGGHLILCIFRCAIHKGNLFSIAKMIIFKLDLDYLNVGSIELLGLMCR